MNIAENLANYLSESRIPVRLACTTPSGWPLVVSLWYLYEDGKLYCATQQTAKTVSYLRQNPQCGFEVAADTPPYCGVRGRGLADLDTENGANILKRLVARYLGSTDSPLANTLLARQDQEVAIAIQPISLFTWNFTERMKDSLPEPPTIRICPE